VNRELLNPSLPPLILRGGIRHSRRLKPAATLDHPPLIPSHQGRGNIGKLSIKGEMQPDPPVEGRG